MNPQQTYDVCMRLTKQYEILQEEAKSIRSRSIPTAYQAQAAEDQYKLNQKVTERIENLMAQICAPSKNPTYGNSQVPTFEYHHDASNPEKESWTYTFRGVGNIIDTINKL